MNSRGTCELVTSGTSSGRSGRVSRLRRSILLTRETLAEHSRVTASDREYPRGTCELLARVIRGSYERPESHTSYVNFRPKSLVSYS